VRAALDEAGPMGQADLGRRCGIHLSDMVATVNELAGQGYVERRPDPGDRRRNVITLTAAGRRRSRVLARKVVEIQDGLLAPLDERDREQLTGLLRRLLAYHTSSGAAGAGGPAAPGPVAGVPRRGQRH
jgi:DNA-binding MarR family transcriptional regulator